MSEHRKEVRLAREAYRAALAGKWESVGRHLRRLNDECGGTGINTGLIAWCDTYIDHATDGEMVPTKSRPAFITVETGELGYQGSPDVPASVQWAGRLLVARAAMDETTWRALIDELPADNGWEVGSYVTAVLECVALTVNSLPRGFARMGREP